MASAKMICPYCKGRGTKVNIDWGLGILSLGTSIIMDLSIPDPCKICMGRGWVTDFVLQK